MGNPLHVLIIEDSEVDALMIILELEKAGYDPTYERVETSEAMLAALHNDTWDVILSDYSMPQFSGMSALELLKESRLDIPFIIVSGKIGEVTAVESMRAGAHDYIMKDNLKRLIPAIERELQEVVVRRERKIAEEALQSAYTQLQAMVQESEKRSREVSLINNMLELLQTRISSEEAYPIITRFAERLLPGISGALYVLNSDKSLSEAVGMWGEFLSGERVFAVGDCLALLYGAVCDSSDKELQCSHIPGDMEGLSTCIPLTAAGEPIGMLHLQTSASMTTKLDEYTRNLATAFANHIALSLSNIKLREILSYQAIHDALTGLFNRRFLEETLEREVHRVRRKDASLGAIMMDLDHFKRFNDTLGHDAGDSLLRSLGKLLLSQVRHEDVACRYGGEEFIMILPEASLDVVQKRAEEIRQMVPRMQVHHRGQLLESITVSLGVAIFPMHGATFEDLLRAADNALYSAKKQGRNRVVIADS